jgi:hypothetical protein
MTARLEQLVKQIMRERDPLKYDQMGSEIWTILDELERLRIPGRGFFGLPKANREDPMNLL